MLWKAQGLHTTQRNAQISAGLSEDVMNRSKCSYKSVSKDSQNDHRRRNAN